MWRLRTNSSFDTNSGGVPRREGSDRLPLPTPNPTEALEVASAGLSDQDIQSVQDLDLPTDEETDANMAIRMNKMKYNKKIFTILILVFISICFGSCDWSNEKMTEAKPSYSNSETEDRKIPEGFVFLGNKGGSWENAERYFIFENRITFLDDEGVGIYSTGFDNKDFIIELNNKYFVNEKMLNELMELAALAPEIRSTKYHIDDVIEIRGKDDTVYSVQIVSLETVRNGSTTTYTIKYAVDSNDKKETVAYNFISSIRTKNGVDYYVYHSVDTNTRTLTLDIKNNEKIGTIVLINPIFQGITYTIYLE